MSRQAPAAVVILAAGQGTRMRSATAKVLHPIAGRSLLGHVLSAARELRPQQLVAVVRHQREQVIEHVTTVDTDVLIADQDEVPGTGRAVQCALTALDAQAAKDGAARDTTGAAQGTTGDAQGTTGDAQGTAGNAQGTTGAARDTTDQGNGPPPAGTVVVLLADVPLLQAGTVEQMLDTHHARGHAVTVLTTHVPDPGGYGRIVRDDDGEVTGIIEHADATEAQRAITEINSGVFAFDADVLRTALGQVGAANTQGEIYLTDVLAYARDAGHRVGAVVVDDAVQVEGVNDRVQLATLGGELNARILRQWMRAGVTVVDPASTWVDVDVELEQDVTLLPGTQLHGGSRIGSGAVIGPDTTLRDVQVGPRARVIRSHGEQARVGAGAEVGPFAYLRAGTVLGENGKIGTFVETKNSQIGPGSKVPHLSYIGDATIGRETNIGAASVTVNYDGVNKERTIVGDYARTGADNMFVAPVSVGDGAYTGAGTVVRRDVPPGALGVSGGSQRNIENWVLHRRPGTPAAQAAITAQQAQQAKAAGDGEQQTVDDGEQQTADDGERQAADDGEWQVARPGDVRAEPQEVQSEQQGEER